LTDDLNITAGLIARHTPAGAGSGGRDAAIIDIAQDLLLRDLHSRKALDRVVFKGGTALRKLYAGRQGRFSLDLDFSLADIGHDLDAVLLDLVGAIDQTRIGPFVYGVTERRGKWSLTVDSPFSDDDLSLTSKLDMSPAVWIEPRVRGWVPMPIQKAYGSPALPHIRVIRLEENIAEKIARLNRVTTARDMYDLSWIAEHRHELKVLDTALIRRLAVLKIWVDSNGLSSPAAVWKPGHEPSQFVPDNWLRVRDADEFDLEDIGALTVPTPSAAHLSTVVRNHFAFLADLDDDERQIALGIEQDRHHVLSLLSGLPGGRLDGIGLY
jgi:predicted nucleotidyltransferase component of viral defense system